MSNTMKLPVGIQEFEKLRNEGYVYLDKTPLIWKMVNEGCYYFLSRPRRFGKSLLMSTIQAFFEGKKQYFDGTVGNPLFIATDESVDWTWEAYPIMHLDLNTDKYSCEEALESRINDFLHRQEELYGARPSEVSFGQRFEGVLDRAYKQTGKRVVVLVDEYDKPLLQAIGNNELQEEFRGTLKSFYAALKSKDGCIKFALLTGVTKFGKVSVFSDMNNLDDISMDWRYHDICGVKESDLHTMLRPAVELLAERNHMSYDDCIAKLRSLYDGYHFCESVEGMYNPFSVLNTLNKSTFGSYWFETGTPTYLATLLVLHDYNLQDMAHAEVDVDVINSVDSESTNPIPVIYQSGYLTIKGYDEEFCLYQLGFPNKEVEDGFVKFLIPYYLNRKSSTSAFDIRNYIADVRNGNAEQLILRIKSLFADTPYELIKDLENHYQNQVWLLHKLLGMYVQAEYHTSFGRIDMVLQTPKYCYVIEFKFDGTAQDALDQISRKDYVLPFVLTGQQIIRIGMNISSRTRNVEEYKIG
ncbi:MAG: ATP-binding protein [Bacteroidales bacterium]|nr:ATP-binding protein [Bacteroidales bacterium]